MVNNALHTRISRRSAIAGAAALLAVPSLAYAQQSTSIKIAGVAEDSVTPALWAYQSGLFRKNGLDVQISSQNSGSAIAAGVAGGSYAIGKSSLTSLITAHSRGLPFVLIAAGGLYDSSTPIVGLIVASESSIRTAADLNGKTVAVSSLNDLYSIAIKAWVDQHGGDSSTLKLVELPIAAVTQAILAGRVDAGGLVVPELQTAVDTGKIRVLCRPYDGIAPQFLYSGWFTTSEYAAKNPQVVSGFVRAMRDASKYANGHHQQTVEPLAKFSSIEPAVISKMTRAAYGTSLDPKLIQPLINVAAKYKVIKAPFDAKELIDTHVV